MRKLLIGLIVIVAIVIGAALIVPQFIPESVYREQIEANAERTLGRDVTLGGPVSIALFPRIQARAETVSIANGENFDNGALAEVSELRAGLALLPLLSRRVEISEFVLVNPTITLVAHRDGTNNWTFGEASGTRAPTPSEEFRRAPGALPVAELSLGDVRIENGSISYTDEAAGASHSLEQVNASISLPALDQELSVDGDAVVDGQPLSVDVRLNSLRTLLEGGEATLRANFESELAALEADGAVPAGEDFAFEGELSASVPSIRALAAAFGNAMPDGETMENASIRGEVSANQGAFAFENARITLDDIEAQGRFGADISGERPRITGELTTASLDLNPYLPEQEGGGAGGGGGVPPWSEEAIDFAPLRIADADITVRAETLQFRDVTLTNANLHLVLDNARLQATIAELGAFDGTGSLDVVVNARSSTPSFEIEGALENIESLELLTSVAQFDRVEGRGTTRFDLRAAGASQAAIMRSLAGTGSFTFRDGALRGVDLGRIARGARDLLSGGVGGLSSALNSREDTDFSELTATFNVANGVATTNDMRMLSPLLRVTGAGDLDIGGQSVDFVLTPALVASAEGQGGASDLSGVEVPVIIQGPWNSVSPRIDTQAALSSIGSIRIGGEEGNSVGEDVGRLVDENIGGDAGDAVRNFLGVPSNDEEADGESGEEAAAEEEVDPLQRALGGILGRDDD